MSNFGRAVKALNDVDVARESWRPVPGYEGLYEVSDFGRVSRLPSVIKTIRGERPTPGRYLKTGPNSDGYPKVCLSRENKKTTLFVHRLVLLAFVGKCKEGEVVCHLDGNPANCHIDNLRWGSQSSNVVDSVNHGTHVETRKTHCPQGHELRGKNIDPGQMSKYGKRRCLACSRAHGFIRGRKSIKPLFKQISEAYYQAIQDGRKAHIRRDILAAANYSEKSGKK